MNALLSRYEGFIQRAAGNAVRVTASSQKVGDSLARLALVVAVAFAAGAAPGAHAQHKNESWTVGIAPVTALSSVGPAARGLDGVSSAHRNIARGIVRGWCDHDGAGLAAGLSVQARNFECRSLRGIGRESAIDQMGDIEMIGARRQVPVFLASSSEAFVRIVESSAASVREPMIVLSSGLVRMFEGLAESERKAALEFLVSRSLALDRGEGVDQADFRAVADAAFVASGAAQARGGVAAAFAFLARGLNEREALVMEAKEVAALESLDREISIVRQGLR